MYILFNTTAAISSFLLSIKLVLFFHSHIYCKETFAVALLNPLGLEYSSYLKYMTQLNNPIYMTRMRK
jgi:hypothetical protein